MRLDSQGEGAKLAARLILALLFIIIVIMVARKSSTRCDTLMTNGTHDRNGCELLGIKTDPMTVS
jgi:hypothetical protein